MDALSSVLSTFLGIIRTFKEFFANLEVELGIDFDELFKKDKE